VDVAVADDRLAVAQREPFRGTVEIESPDEHRVALDGIEQIGMPFQILPHRMRFPEERVRRHDQSARTLPEPCEIGEGPNIFGAAGVIQQQHGRPSMVRSMPGISTRPRSAAYGTAARRSSWRSCRVIAIAS
jgi:hypothetical protein